MQNVIKSRCMYLDGFQVFPSKSYVLNHSESIIDMHIVNFSLLGYFLRLPIEVIFAALKIALKYD